MLAAPKLKLTLATATPVESGEIGRKMQQLKPPTELKSSGNAEEQWRQFKQRFTLLSTCDGGTEKSDGQKIARGNSSWDQLTKLDQTPRNGTKPTS